MKIAQIAPLYEAVPPSLYGGTERIVAHLTNALVELGHDVTLFASADAHTRATLVPVRGQAIRLDQSPLKSDLAAHLSMLHELHLRRHEFDLLHFHVDLIHFPFFEDLAAQTVTTLHGRLDLKDLSEVYSRWRDYPLVSISDDQRKPLASANWLATVHHGLAGDVYSYNETPSDSYLAFLGRISPEKRPDRAISIAKRLGMPLKIAAKVDAVDVGYFRDEIKPLLADPLIEFIGEIGDSDKSAFLGNANALLFPIDWPEPRCDTTTPHGRLLTVLLGGIAEFERELIRARTGEGRKRAKARGVRFGRPPKLTPHQRQEAMRRLSAGEAQADVARTYNVDASTISRLLGDRPFPGGASLVGPPS